MSLLEKTFSIIALCYIISLALFLVFYPAARDVTILLPLSLLGVGFNAGLLFVVFKDIFSRRFASPARKIVWAAVIFLFMPALLLYLPLHGFRRRH